MSILFSVLEYSLANPAPVNSAVAVEVEAVRTGVPYRLRFVVAHAERTHFLLLLHRHHKTLPHLLIAQKATC